MVKPRRALPMASKPSNALYGRYESAESRERFMAEKLIVVRVAYDPEAQVWWIESSDLSGLHAEGATLEELRDKLPGMISDLIEDNEPSWRNHDIVVEIIAHGQLSTRAPAVAAA
jgi:predicted RNase H-like HicB family nuclease